MTKIAIYTTRTCPFCRMQKEYFESKNIQYDEILVDENPTEAQKMIEISGQMGVPFTVNPPSFIPILDTSYLIPDT